MFACIQYHNAMKLGWVPLDARPFEATRLSAFTRAPAAARAIGARVYLIVGVGRPRRYYLWETFTVEELRPDGDAFGLLGPGWQLAPPQRLSGPAFEAFRRACGWLVGFRSIDTLDYRHTLAELAERHRAAALAESVDRFCSELLPHLPGVGDGHYYRGYVRHRLGRHADARFDLMEALRLGTTHAAEAEALLRRRE